MNLAVLFSGGKDSNYALYLASKNHKIKCLINLESKNPDSYMFQTAGTNILSLQSKSLQIPLLKFKTKGEKEKELKDLKKAIKKAMKEYQIEGIVTGAIQSSYQALRIQKICHELNIWCFNPLWQINENKYILELLENKFNIILIKIAAYPLTKEYLKKRITKSLTKELEKMNVSTIGEGGEFETLVLDSPLFTKKIKLDKTSIIYDSENSAELIIKEASLK